MRRLHIRAQLSAAPLKHTQDAKYSRFPQAYPRSAERGPIEAAKRVESRSVCIDIRAQLSAAPLKPAAAKNRLSRPGDIRAQLSAAPLKQTAVFPLRIFKQLYPRSAERGPIEAQSVRDAGGDQLAYPR